jgi:hypothetical protein
MYDAGILHNSVISCAPVELIVARPWQGVTLLMTHSSLASDAPFYAPNIHMFFLHDFAERANA